MRIMYKYANGETSIIEVTEEWAEAILELNRKEYNINHKETRRHKAFDSYDYLDDQANINPCLSRDAFEYRNGICSDSAEIAADLESKYRRKHIRNAMDKIKPKQRELIQAIYFWGVSVKDYAAKEGVDHSAISHRLQTAYKNLKKFL